MKTFSVNKTSWHYRLNVRMAKTNDRLNRDEHDEKFVQSKGKVFFLEGRRLCSGGVQGMNLGTFVLLKDSTDRRGRVYSREDLERAAVGKTFMGELVPLDGFTDTNLDLNRVSHTVNDIRFVGEDLVGNIMTMPTPMGMILKTFHEEGIRLATSIRAVGRISEDNSVSDLEIFTFDFLMEKAE